MANRSHGHNRKCDRGQRDLISMNRTAIFVPRKKLLMQKKGFNVGFYVAKEDFYEPIRLLRKCDGMFLSLARKMFLFFTKGHRHTCCIAVC